MKVTNLGYRCSVILSTLILILGICAVIPGQSLSNPPKGFLVDYDKFKDHSDVSYLSNDYKGLLQSWISFNYKGQSLERDVETFYVTFSGTGRCGGFCFNRPTLILLIDGERYSIPNKQLADIVRFPLGRPIVEKLANAKLVEFQVGKYEEVWKRKGIEKWRQLLALGTVK